MRIAPLVGKQQESYRLSDEPGGHLWEGSVRSSKTVTSVIRWIRYIRTGPPGDLAMIGKTERTLKRNILDLMVAILGADRCKVSTGNGEASVLGRRIYLAGANDEKAAAKIQGMTLAGFYGDEISTWPESVFSIARTRLSVDGAAWFGTTNPGSTTHWLKTDFVDRCRLHLTRDGKLLRMAGDDRLDVNVYSFQIDDNPTLPPDFVRRLKREYVGVFYKRFILGQWCMAEGAIYDMFDESVHVIDDAKIPHITRWIGSGIDYGTRNPFHALIMGMGYDPIEKAQCLYITHEWRHDSREARRQMTDSEYSKAVREWWPSVELPGHTRANPIQGITPQYVVIDPSAASFRVQLHQDGVTSLAADNDVLGGIRLMSSLYANRRIKIARRCAGLIREIPGYAWDDRAAKLGRDEPVKVGDHGLDAKRYLGYTTQSAWWHDIYPDYPGAR